MTPGSREGIGVDGRRNPSRKPDGCDEEENGEQASEERSTKGEDGVEILNPSTTGLSSGSAPVLPASAPNRTGPGSTQPPQTSAEPGPPGPDQHHFLRSSVRPPSKRIRKDSIGSSINGHGGAKSKGAENGSSSQGVVGQTGPVVSATGGVSKTSKGQGSTEKEEQAGNQKRARRQWESWSAEDKNSFFEGLYEHGKDFEAIQNNIAMKYKKRGKPANMVKNKEQVRHFYYRTWHKISKHIDFANVYSRVLKKSSQELYGLICYAELRKKVGGLMDDKNVAKLNELIQQGATTVRSKGRNLRIKAPMCRALKKLCDPDGVSDEEDQKPVRLPLKVAVELQPRSNHSWARVQSLLTSSVFFCFLRMVVELHRKVSSLIEYLKQKWAYHDQRIREALEGNQTSTASPSITQKEELFLFPAESCTLTALPGVARVVHSKASCTVHWIESGKSRPNAKELPAAQILGIHAAPQPRTGSKSGRASAAVAGASLTITGDARRTETPNPDPSADSSAKVEEKRLQSPCVPVSSQQTVREEGDGMGSSDPGKACTGVEVSGGLAMTRSTDRSCSGADGSAEQYKEEQSTIKPPVTGSDEAASQASPPATKERVVEQIREEGWSARDAENVTLAELYLMFGKPGKLQLEYEWQPPKPDRTNRVLRCLLKLVSTEVNPKPLAPELCSTATSPLKTYQEEQNQVLTPPAKGPVAGARSPSCGRPQNGVPPPSPGVTGGGDSLLSPPSVASLLDISLPGPPEEALTPGEPQTQISDSIIELAINSTHYGEEAALSPAKLGNSDGSKLLASSPSLSPSRGWIPSPSHDPQWYPSDSSDSTLGCLLSSMVSPDKGRRTTLTPTGPSSGTALLGPSLLDCNSHDSFQSRGLPDVAEMDSQLACMMSESSIDYIARFNDLAQELAVTEPSIPPP
uniref:Protein cramped-like n=1 Tax=Neolamprologus brichardi TaxID=32507 RepID=A0A3Q4MEQ1_NEOBR